MKSRPFRQPTAGARIPAGSTRRGNSARGSRCFIFRGPTSSTAGAGCRGSTQQIWNRFEWRLATSAPVRLVSLQPSASVVLERIGMLDRLVGCTKWCRDLCPGIPEGCGIVADSWSSTAAEIQALKPDLVLASVPYREESLAEILKAGVPVLALAPKSLADIYKDIALIAAVAGVADRAGPVIENMRQEIECVRALARELPRPRVFCEEWGRPIIRSQPWVKEMVQAAGGEFLGAPGTMVEAQNIIEEQPDVLIAAWCGAGNRVPLQKMIHQRNWHELPAARLRRVYCIRDEFLNTPAPTLVHGLKALAAAIHPEAFPAAAGLRKMGH
ncbi:MAG: ABC transporter substrate-binding protein [Acidobacteria bacterium]|nr:ABC transporter substrate-binding protein [Acidobacteriota bacterium]